MKFGGPHNELETIVVILFILKRLRLLRKSLKRLLPDNWLKQNLLQKFWTQKSGQKILYQAVHFFSLISKKNLGVKGNMLRILKLMWSLSQLLIQICLGENVQRLRWSWRRRQGIGSRPKREQHVLSIQLMQQNELYPNPTRLKLQASLPISNSPLKLHVEMHLRNPTQVMLSLL